MPSYSSMNDLIEKWIDTDPVIVALKTGDRELADRIDILQRARKKLPSYFAAKAEFSRIELEQCTSEAIASQRGYQGGSLAIDLTTGLGVDSYYLSKSYRKVISVEIDPSRSKSAEVNFQLLGANNVQTVNSSAEDFIKNFNEVADIIFIDPARRDDVGNRIYDISLTKPDVISLLPTLLSHCKELRIKCSPMFDVDELEKQFNHQCSVETISYDGECKETVVHIDGKPLRRMATIVSSKRETRFLAFNLSMNDYSTSDTCRNPDNQSEGDVSLTDMRYLLSFDVALVKSRLVSDFISEFHPSIKYVSVGSYILSDKEIADSAVNCRKIASIEPFSPSKLKKQIKGKQISVLRKGFPISMEILKKQIGFREGGKEEIAFIEFASSKYTIRF